MYQAQPSMIMVLGEMLGKGLWWSALRTRQSCRGVRGLIVLHPSGNCGPIAEFSEASNAGDAQSYPHKLAINPHSSLNTYISKIDS